MTPKVIHQIVGPNPSSLIAKCLGSWSKLIPFDFKIIVWDDTLLEHFIKSNYNFALEAFLNSRNYAERADIARYLIIYHFGGYYIDWDVELLDTKLFLKICKQNPNGYLVQDPANRTIASEVFSATRKEKYLWSLIQNIVTIYDNNFRDYLSTPEYSGPHRMREVYYFTKQKTLQNVILINDIFLYNYEEIRKKPRRKIKRALIHYWNHAWVKVN